MFEALFFSAIYLRKRTIIKKKRFWKQFSLIIIQLVIFVIPNLRKTSLHCQWKFFSVTSPPELQEAQAYYKTLPHSKQNANKILPTCENVEKIHKKRSCLQYLLCSWTISLNLFNYICSWRMPVITSIVDKTLIN